MRIQFLFDPFIWDLIPYTDHDLAEPNPSKEWGWLFFGVRIWLNG